MVALRDTNLIDASVPAEATFLDAARTLASAGLSAIAVVGADGRVIGLFTEDDLVAGLFPRYLRELRHTAFAEDDRAALAERLRRAGSQPVVEHMSKPVTVEVDTSATHAAERFLHNQWGAFAVVEHGRFLGMLSQIDFARRLLDRLELS
jgi:CBS domain-containing protein